MEENTSLYVGLPNQGEIRRNILESSRTIVSSLQQHQKVINIQIEKQKVKIKLKKDVSEIRMLLLKLQRLFPKDTENFRSHKEELPILEIKDETQEGIDKLHTQLSSIEERLKSIDKQ